MKRVASVVVLLVLSLAAAHAVGKSTKTLKDFRPDKLGDVKRQPSVENAKTPNEALEWLPKMDLKSLAAFAREK